MFRGRSGAISFVMRSSEARQNLVVACCPVPKLMPGSSTISMRPASGTTGSHVGRISSLGETRIGLKWIFQDSAQFSFLSSERANPERTTPNSFQFSDSVRRNASAVSADARS